MSVQRARKQCGAGHCVLEVEAEPPSRDAGPCLEQMARLPMVTFVTVLFSVRLFCKWRVEKVVGDNA